jgi:chromate reductase
MAATKPENRTALIVGSPRKQSFIRMVAKTLISLAPDSVRLEILRIGQLPMYNQDLDDNPPKEWDDFRSNLNKFDAVIFVTPELNRSGPGVLKNAFSLASQTFERNTVSENACSAISISIGALGGFGASCRQRT